MRSFPLSVFASSLLAGAPSAQGTAPALNEIYVRHTGTDDREFVELLAEPGLSLDGYVLIVVDGDRPVAGTVDQAVDLTGHLVPDDGYFVAGDATVSNVDLVLGSVEVFENGTQTWYLVWTDDVSAVLSLVGTNVDPDGDGDTTIPHTTQVVDIVALMDSDSGVILDFVFDQALAFGPDGLALPAGIFRGSDAPAPWCSNFLDPDADANLDLPRTPGAANGTCLGVDLLKLVSSDGQPQAGFGRAVALDGQHIVIGAPYQDELGDLSGCAYVFSAATGAQIAKLVPEDGAAQDFFGQSVALGGNAVFVGAAGDDDMGPGTGSVYVFDPATGAQLHKVVPDDVEAGDHFGFDLAADGSILIVGAHGAGSVYVFDVDTLQLLRKLRADDQARGSFGNKLAISGTTALVGAPFDQSGSAYLFDVASGRQIAKLLPQENTYAFSRGLAIDGERALVGDHNLGAGSVYVFDATTGTLLDRLYATDGVDGDAFGISLALRGTTALVASPKCHAQGNDSGALYLFDLATGLQKDKIVPDGIGAGDDFGWPVAVHGLMTVAGAYGDDDAGPDAGAAYFFPALGCDGVVNYCAISPNSAGAGARILGQGSTSIQAGEFELQAFGLPLRQFGIFCYGADEANLPFGNGTLCIGPPLFRLSVVQSDLFGFVAYALDFDGPPSTGGAIEVGSSWRFQLWYRDPTAGGAGFITQYNVSFCEKSRDDLVAAEETVRRGVEAARRAVELAPEREEYEVTLMQLFTAQRLQYEEVGDHARAVRSTEQMLALVPELTEAWQRAATAYANASTLARGDEWITPEEREEAAARYAERACELTREAVQRGVESTDLMALQSLPPLHGTAPFEELLVWFEEWKAAHPRPSAGE